MTGPGKPHSWQPVSCELIGPRERAEQRATPTREVLHLARVRSQGAPRVGHPRCSRIGVHTNPPVSSVLLPIRLSLGIGTAFSSLEPRLLRGVVLAQQHWSAAVEVFFDQPTQQEGAFYCRLTLIRQAI
jgi:hypothetical protein